MHDDTPLWQVLLGAIGPMLLGFGAILAARNSRETRRQKILEDLLKEARSDLEAIKTEALIEERISKRKIEELEETINHLNESIEEQRMLSTSVKRETTRKLSSTSDHIGRVSEELSDYEIKTQQRRKR